MNPPPLSSVLPYSIIPCVLLVEYIKTIKSQKQFILVFVTPAVMTKTSSGFEKFHLKQKTPTCPTALFIFHLIFHYFGLHDAFGNLMMLRVLS